MTDLMVKAKRFLYEKFENSTHVEIRFSEMLKTFSSNLYELFGEIINISKKIRVRFDWDAYMKDNPPNETVLNAKEFTPSLLDRLTKSSVEVDLMKLGIFEKEGVCLNNCLLSEETKHKLLHYGNYLYLDINSKDDLSKEKADFFTYLKSYVKQSAEEYKLPYAKQKEDFKKDIQEIAQHCNVEPFFFDIACYSENMYTPYHILVTLEKEEEIKINQLSQSGAIITALKQADSIPTTVILKINAANREIFLNDKKLSISGIYIYKLLAALNHLGWKNMHGYINEAEIHDYFGYDIEESIAVSKSRRTYHTIRNFNRSIALETGITDVVQKKKGSISYRINPHVDVEIIT